MQFVRRRVIDSDSRLLAPVIIIEAGRRGGYLAVRRIGDTIVHRQRQLVDLAAIPPDMHSRRVGLIERDTIVGLNWQVGIDAITPDMNRLSAYAESTECCYYKKDIGPFHNP